MYDTFSTNLERYARDHYAYLLADAKLVLESENTYLNFPISQIIYTTDQLR